MTEPNGLSLQTTNFKQIKGTALFDGVSIKISEVERNGEKFMRVDTLEIKPIKVYTATIPAVKAGP